MERGRRGLTKAEKDAVWVQYRAGTSFAATGRALGHTTSTINWGVRALGGVAPVAQRRARGALTASRRLDGARERRAIRVGRS